MDDELYAFRQSMRVVFSFQPKPLVRGTLVSCEGLTCAAFFDGNCFVRLRAPAASRVRHFQQFAGVSRATILDGSGFVLRGPAASSSGGHCDALVAVRGFAGWFARIERAARGVLRSWCFRLSTLE